MQSPVEVRQLKIRRLERRQSAAASAGRLAEVPNVMLGIVQDRLADKACKFREIEVPALFANEVRLAADRNRHADLAFANAFGFELPAAYVGEVAGVDPKIVGFSCSIDRLRKTISVYDSQRDVVNPLILAVGRLALRRVYQKPCRPQNRRRGSRGSAQYFRLLC